MKIAHSACTDIGLLRSANEDYFRIVPEIGLYILTDGMGGARGGGHASRLAADAVAEHMQQAGKPDASILMKLSSTPTIRCGKPPRKIRR